MGKRAIPPLRPSSNFELSSALANHGEAEVRRDRGTLNFFPGSVVKILIVVGLYRWAWLVDVYGERGGDEAYSAMVVVVRSGRVMLLKK